MILFLITIVFQEELDLGISTRTGMMSPMHIRTSSIPQAVIPAAIPSSQATDAENTRAYIERVRLLILGMEQRLKTREEKLTKTVEIAQAEGARYDEAKRKALTT